MDNMPKKPKTFDDCLDDMLKSEEAKDVLEISNEIVKECMEEGILTGLFNPENEEKACKLVAKNILALMIARKISGEEEEEGE